MKIVIQFQRRKWLGVALLTSLVMVGCSKGPSEKDVETLIEAQYAHAQNMMDEAVASAGHDEMANAMGNMLNGLMPTLEDVADVNCDSVEGDNTYMCTADITQTIAGNTRTDRGSFKVYKINDEWVLDN